jgi:CO/xanthine dehydrogenase FAD-binding subunit
MDSRYERPSSVAEACSLLAGAGEGTVILAGGTDLQIRLRDGAVAAPQIIDIKRIEELTRVTLSATGELSIGAGVTLRQLYEDPRVAEPYPALAKAALAVGSLQVRCRATLGGNLCNASPCMDTAPVLLLLGAKLRLASAKGERELPLASFFVGVKKTELAKGELCTAIILPASARPTKVAFGKIKRVRGHDLALVNAAVAYDPQARTLRAAIGSCAPTPVTTKALDNVTLERGKASELGAKLAALALEIVRPIDDVRASAEYRRDMAAHLCRRLVAELALAGGRP